MHVFMEIHGPWASYEVQENGSITEIHLFTLPLLGGAYVLIIYRLP